MLARQEAFLGVDRQPGERDIGYRPKMLRLLPVAGSELTELGFMAEIQDGRSSKSPCIAGPGLPDDPTKPGVEIMRDLLHCRSMDADRKARAERRRGRVVAHVSTSYEEADRWDLAYWQACGPQARLSALVAIHRDVAAVDPSHVVPRTRWTP